MKVLVLGSGGREHAIVWKLAQSRHTDKIFCIPGNAGIAQIAKTHNIKLDDFKSLINFVKANNIGLTVVGPEMPLANGIVDEFQKYGLRIFGPSKRCSRLEASKIFAKQIMRKFGVPTADFNVFSDFDKAVAFSRKLNPPIVIKADGLCAGKGVVIATSFGQAQDALDLMLNKKSLGVAADKVMVEEYLEGEEASILALCDGKNIAPLASSQDHKRIFDKDRGPNTGGMGAYSPAPVITGKLFDLIKKDIFNPIIKGLAKEGYSYKGVLYAGIMITKQGPKVLEFNVRFGDPETEAILPRLKNDLVECIDACIDGRLDKIKLRWDKRPCVCVVVTSGGYPGQYEKGKVISGLDKASDMKDVLVFHAGTRSEIIDDGVEIVTDGGRVLGVTALGATIKAAIDKAYEAAGKISFDGMHYRKDIGHRALQNLKCKMQK